MSKTYIRPIMMKIFTLRGLCLNYGLITGNLETSIWLGRYLAGEGEMWSRVSTTWRKDSTLLRQDIFVGSSVAWPELCQVPRNVVFFLFRVYIGIFLLHSFICCSFHGLQKHPVKCISFWKEADFAWEKSGKEPVRICKFKRFGIFWKVLKNILWI